MEEDESDSARVALASRTASAATLKALLAAAVALAIAIGLALPAPHKAAPTRSQFATIELAPG